MPESTPPEFPSRTFYDLWKRIVRNILYDIPRLISTINTTYF